MGLKIDNNFENDNEIIDDEFDDVVETDTPVEADKAKQHEHNVNDDDFDDEDDYITPPSQLRRRRIRIAFWAIAIAIIVFAFVKIVMLGRTVDEGNVRAFAISLEKKGFLFDSYEGEFAYENTPDSLIRFSVTDAKVGKYIYRIMQTDSVLLLSYRRYRAAMPWRGETKTVVYQALAVDRVTPNPAPKKKETKE